MNVAASALNLEIPGTSSPALNGDGMLRAGARQPAGGSAPVVTSAPFLSLLDWLTNDLASADVADQASDPPKKEDKAGHQDSQGVLSIELPKALAQIKPPIVLDRQNTAVSLAGSTDQTENTGQVAPTDADRPAAGTPTAAMTRADLAFGALLTEHTPTPPTEPISLTKDSTTPQVSVAREAAPSTESAELKPANTASTSDAHPGPEDRQNSSPEKHPQSQAQPPMVSAVTGGTHEQPQNVSSTKPGLSNSPKAELKTEINAAVRPQPTREISLKLTGTEAGSVDVRISERGGKVQVDVRTPNGELARSLRSDLGDLVGRLEKRGFDAQTWTPGVRSAAAPANAGDSDANSGQASRQFQGGSGQHGQNQRDGRPRQQQRLEFLRKFKNSMSFATSRSIPDGNKENYVNTGN